MTKAGRAARRVTSTARATVRRGRDVVRRRDPAGLNLLPETARRELRESLRRASRVRTPAAALRFFEDELDRLVRVTMPLAVRHPLPLAKSTTVARGLAGAGAGGAALLEELAAAATVASGGAGGAAGVPTVAAAVLASSVLEIYLAASVRVHAIRRAGLTPEPDAVAADVLAALGGNRGSRDVMKALVRRYLPRLGARVGIGAAPVLGAAYSGFDAQRTVNAVARLPVPKWWGRPPIDVTVVEGRDDPARTLPVGDADSSRR